MRYASMEIHIKPVAADGRWPLRDSLDERTTSETRRCDTFNFQPDKICLTRPLSDAMRVRPLAHLAHGIRRRSNTFPRNARTLNSDFCAYTLSIPDFGALSLLRYATKSNLEYRIA
ncbi:hypothetical protein EVAR_88974_1 [Eumeta japonica]|uniref:Uncharacterized protein n=1 Tax=Eumeta variegata TaxID=151549 RepID=A0A4C1VQH6_EUMVA|nr:hypothetical protein EVAR_88974_1 [Eumeta japonica]